MSVIPKEQWKLGQIVWVEPYSVFDGGFLGTPLPKPNDPEGHILELSLDCRAVIAEEGSGGLRVCGRHPWDKRPVHDSPTSALCAAANERIGDLATRLEEHKEILRLIKRMAEEGKLNQ